MGVRVAVAGIFHESNSYVPETPAESFTVARGRDVVAAGANEQTFIGGIVRGALAVGVEPIGILMADAPPGGLVQHRAYQALRDELVTLLYDAGPVDGVVLVLHGAGATTELDDIETDVAAATRAVVGDNVPTVATLDLHGNLSPRLADHLDAAFCTREYPHDDMAARGDEAIRWIARLVRGRLRSHLHIEPLPMLFPPQSTYDGTAADILAISDDVERREGIIDCTFAHGFTHTDTPLVGASVLTVAQSKQQARAGARNAAARIWQLRHRTAQLHPSPVQAVELALHTAATAGGPVVINDAADNPGGGAAGDGTLLLHALLESGAAGAVVGCLADAATVGEAHAAGVGTEIEIRLGGKSDPRCGDPVVGRAYVKALTDGVTTFECAYAAGAPLLMGRTALLHVKGVEVVVTEHPCQVFDRMPFLLHGIDVSTRQIIALKSNVHFRSGFRKLATAIVTADYAGPTGLDPTILTRQRVRRPIYPLDDDARYPEGDAS